MSVAEARGSTAAERGTTFKPPGKARPGRASKPMGHEAHYSSKIFRSRLEARWAIYLDLLRIDWDYEPSPYQVGPKLNYLPDFYLPELQIWLEVKGTYFMDAEAMAKVTAAVAGPTPIALREHPYDTAEHLIMGGEFRRFDDGLTPVHTLVTRGEKEHTATFAPVTFSKVHGSWMLAAVGKLWGSYPATGVPTRQRPGETMVKQLLEPLPLVGETDPMLSWAYRAAAALKFDDASDGGKLSRTRNDAEVLRLLARRRAGRPLPQRLWGTGTQML